jgi:bacterioferritin (cytochrome b1)
MLLSRDEMRFDFGGAKFDPVRDKATIAWAMNQFLYGEVTGIQIGHWLYEAPDIEAARFLARQAVEEFQHVGNFVQILELLGERPGEAHPIAKFLATGAMPSTWAEHVALEMAVGEGLVLQCFYAMIETIDDARIVAILERGVKQEERHVDFGEQRTIALVRQDPSLGPLLLGQAIVTIAAVERLGAFMRRTLPKDHPVLAQLPTFVEHTLAMLEERLVRMGLADGPVRAQSLGSRLSTVGRSFASKAGRALTRRPSPRLTERYLRDPAVFRD